MAPMALSDSKVNNDKSCSKTFLTNYETLKKQYDDLIFKLHETEFKAATYKRGLTTVEAQLVTHRKNEEKEGIDFKIEKFENASKELDKQLGSQITDNSKKGLGYHAVPPPHPLIYNDPTKLDLSYSGLEEFQQPEFEGYGLRANKSVCENYSNETKKNSDAPLIEEWVYDNEDEVESPVVVEKKTVVPTIPKVDVVVRHPKQTRKTQFSEIVTGNPETYLKVSVRSNSLEDKKVWREEHFILPIQVSTARVDVSTAKDYKVHNSNWFVLLVHKLSTANEESQNNTASFVVNTATLNRIKTYEGYELNNNMTGDLEEPWSDNGSDIDGFCNGGELPEMVRVGCMTYFQDHKWYDELVDGKFKLKSSFENFHELDHDVLVKLEECWWKVNAHEVAPFTRWENYGQGPHANAKTKRAYDHYLDINCIFGRNYGADNTDNTQDNQEHKKEHHDPSTYRVRRFVMIKYSFDTDDEYIAIKEHECSDHSKTNIDTCQAYRELFCIMDEGWLVKKACDE
ncbi:hypothetical protein Tco_0401647 [Tanacetum coccineum]